VRPLAAWAEQKAVREIMVFLHSHGVSTARAVRAWCWCCTIGNYIDRRKRNDNVR
jgi:hypothetical protein